MAAVKKARRIVQHVAQAEHFNIMIMHDNPKFAPGVGGQNQWAHAADAFKKL